MAYSAVGSSTEPSGLPGTSPANAVNGYRRTLMVDRRQVQVRLTLPAQIALRTAAEQQRVSSGELVEQMLERCGYWDPTKETE